ncbi:metal-sensitive transcriptional regulator [Candidatus Microgenomates bacterium]|nr:metal-sensitive transcriptional regulator [Candidatus Microgenomates bacterium]
MNNQRINRIVGQLKGIQRMMDSQRECSDILQQISAVKNAIDGLSKELVVADMCKNMEESEKKRIEKVVDRVLAM